MTFGTSLRKTFIEVIPTPEKGYWYKLFSWRFYFSLHQANLWGSDPLRTRARNISGAPTQVLGLRVPRIFQRLGPGLKAEIRHVPVLKGVVDVGRGATK